MEFTYEKDFAAMSYSEAKAYFREYAKDKSADQLRLRLKTVFLVDRIAPWAKTENSTVKYRAAWGRHAV